MAEILVLGLNSDTEPILNLKSQSALPVISSHSKVPLANFSIQEEMEQYWLTQLSIIHTSTLLVSIFLNLNSMKIGHQLYHWIQRPTLLEESFHSPINSGKPSKDTSILINWQQLSQRLLQYKQNQLAVFLPKKEGTSRNSLLPCSGHTQLRANSKHNSKLVIQLIFPKKKYISPIIRVAIKWKLTSNTRSKPISQFKEHRLHSFLKQAVVI